MRLRTYVFLLSKLLTRLLKFVICLYKTSINGGGHGSIYICLSYDPYHCTKPKWFRNHAITSLYNLLCTLVYWAKWLSQLAQIVALNIHIVSKRSVLSPCSICSSTSYYHKCWYLHVVVLPGSLYNGSTPLVIIICRIRRLLDLLLKLATRYNAQNQELTILISYTSIISELDSSTIFFDK